MSGVSGNGISSGSIECCAGEKGDVGSMVECCVESTVGEYNMYTAKQALPGVAYDEDYGHVTW
jgi:hypothetical protein